MSRAWATIAVVNTIPNVNIAVPGAFSVTNSPGEIAYEGIEICGRVTAGNPADKLVLLRRDILPNGDYRYCPVKPDKAALPQTDGVSGWFNFQFFLARSTVLGDFALYCPISLIMGVSNLEAPRARMF